MRVLVTGSEGFIGRRVMRLLEAEGHTAVGFDAPKDVLSPRELSERGAELCDAAIHLAADKFAGHGEEHPHRVSRLNIDGTQNVVDAVPRVVLASTCKAAAPITAYGASKLIAERVVLNANGVVVRLVNVLGSSGSVTEIWDALPRSQSLPVTDSERMYMEPDEAARLFVRALDLEPGRYGPSAFERLNTIDLARRLHPGRTTRWVPLRRGDRRVERLANDYEVVEPEGDGLVRIVDCWERAERPLEAVA